MATLCRKDLATSTSTGFISYNQSALKFNPFRDVCITSDIVNISLSISPLLISIYNCLILRLLCLYRFRFSPLKPEQISSRLNDIVRAENVNSTEDGKRALMELAAGDMRRVLNLLQSTHMAYPVVNEENVYLTAGAALPAVIQSIFNSLLNDTFENAHKLLSNVSYCALPFQ